ncbi:MAG: sugar ABC transporter substrate-binding protein [Firmicutes bacterium]|nr:sugar ABC transporter substrate-binding protein [Bacillota bacterium]
MRNFNKILRVVCLLALALVMCVTLITMGGSAASKKLVVGYATKSATNQGWILINNGAKQAAKDLGVDLIMLGPPKENDIAGQLAVVEDLINRKVDALAIAPCDSTGIAPAVEKANRLGIPVVAVDTAIYGAKVTSFVATDNLKAAASAAKWVGEKLGGKGNIVMINGMIAQQTGKDRRDGFYNYIKEHYPNMKIVAEVPAEWQTEKALSGMEDALRANDQIDAVFCAWDGGTIGALQALEAAKRKSKTLLVGFDAAPDALKAMRQGKVDADIAQFLFKIGYEGIATAVKAARGEKVPERVDTGSMVVTPENLEKFIKDNHIPVR